MVEINYVSGISGCCPTPHFEDDTLVFRMNDRDATKCRHFKHAAQQEFIGHPPTWNGHEPFEASDPAIDNLWDLFQSFLQRLSDVHVKGKIHATVARGEGHSC